MPGKRTDMQAALFYEFDLDRHVLGDQLLARCIAEGLVGGESFGADASIIRADASPHNKTAFSDWSAPDEITRATREYLDTLDDAAFGAATPVKPKCCPRAPMRKVMRHVYEGARDMARDITGTAAFVASSRARKKVEMLFAHLKRILRLHRLRLRGPNGAGDEFHLAATAQNQRKLLKLIPMPSAQAA